MARIHVVQVGEHISAIAAQYGFSDFETIWNVEANGQLRMLRKDPHQLAPGDKVAIPDAKPRTYVRATGAVHTFVVHVEKLKLRLELLDMARKPSPHIATKLGVGTLTKELATDGNGVLEAMVARDCRTGTLEIGKCEYPLAIGALEPASTLLGQIARLVNLGYWYGADDQPDDPDAFKLAVELFQSAHGQAPTGEADADFVTKLNQTHDGKE